MDETDPKIKFDHKGLCNHFSNYYKNIQPIWNNDGKKENQIINLANKIKNENKHKDFDCILGISGGVDSSYLAYYAKNNRLESLNLSCGCRWNSELAVSNIDKIISGLNLNYIQK